MTERPFTRTDADGDDWLDAALCADGREHRATYLDDAGFTARVMAALPAPATLPAWRKPALAVLWAIAGIGVALALPGAVAEFTYDTLRFVVGQRMSLAGVATGILALGAATWAAAAMVLRDD